MGGKRQLEFFTEMYCFVNVEFVSSREATAKGCILSVTLKHMNSVVGCRQLMN